MGAQGEARAERFGRGRVAVAEQRDLAGTGVLDQLQRGLDGEFIVGTEHVFHAVARDVLPVVRDPDTGFRVGDPLDADGDVHASSLQKRPHKRETHRGHGTAG